MVFPPVPGLDNSFCEEIFPKIQSVSSGATWSHFHLSYQRTRFVIPLWNLSLGLPATLQGGILSWARGRKDRWWNPDRAQWQLWLFHHECQVCKEHSKSLCQLQRAQTTWDQPYSLWGDWGDPNLIILGFFLKFVSVLNFALVFIPFPSSLTRSWRMKLF